MDIKQMQEEILRLQAQLKAQRQAQGGLSLKVSEKGAISVYGMGRFPVTLYAEQWNKLAKFVPTIQEFIEANKSSLSYKTETQAQVQA